MWRPHSAHRGEAVEATTLRPAVARALAAGAVVPVALLAGLVVLHGRLEAERSQKALVHAYAAQRSSPGSPLVYFRDRPDSAQFYALGTAQRAPDAAALHARVDAPAGAFFAIRDRDLASLPPDDRPRLEEIGSYGAFHLLHKPPR